MVEDLKKGGWFETSFSLGVCFPPITLGSQGTALFFMRWVALCYSIGSQRPRTALNKTKNLSNVKRTSDEAEDKSF